MHLAGKQCVSRKLSKDGSHYRLTIQKFRQIDIQAVRHYTMTWSWLLDDEVRPAHWQIDAATTLEKSGAITGGIAAGFTTVCLTFSAGLLTLRNRLTRIRRHPDSTESNALSGFSSGLSHMTELVDTLLAIGIASTTLLILLGGYFYVFSTARLEHLSSGRQDTLPTEIGTTADEV